MALTKVTDTLFTIGTADTQIIYSSGNTVTGNSNLTWNNTSAVLTVTGNAAVGNLSATGAITATVNVTGNYIFGNGALLTGVITSVANINLGTSNVTVTSSGGNVTVGIGGTNNIAVFATTGEYITGVLSVTGNANVGNLGTAGNITASYFFGNGSQLTGVTASATSLINGNSNVVVAANGNVSTSVAGTANVVVITSSGVNISGTAAVTGVLTGRTNVVLQGSSLNPLVAQTTYIVTANSITLTLPASPTTGDRISFSPKDTTINSYTIARNGNNIMGNASDLTVDTAATFSLLYNSTVGWVLN